MHRDAVSLLSVAMLAVVAAASDLSAQTITQLIVTHKTANVARAGTDSPFTLLVRPTTGSLCSREFPTYDYDERETGGTDTYVFDVLGCRLQREQVDSANVFVRTRGRNAWLPQHFKLIAKMVDGTQRSVVDRSWPSTNWFGADPSDAIRGGGKKRVATECAGYDWPVHRYLHSEAVDVWHVDMAAVHGHHHILWITAKLSAECIQGSAILQQARKLVKYAGDPL